MDTKHPFRVHFNCSIGYWLFKQHRMGDLDGAFRVLLLALQTAQDGRPGWSIYSIGYWLSKQRRMGDLDGAFTVLAIGSPNSAGWET